MNDYSSRTEFTSIYKQYIKRDGSEKLLDYLTNKSDFFEAPASSRFHCAYQGGLAQHSVNVYRCLVDILSRERVKNVYKIKYSEESAAIAALLHDVCKTDVYKKDFRNVKNEEGKWERVPIFRFEDNLPYGHGEKSVYMISGFMKLTRDEAMAIRWHMGFSGPEDASTVGKAFEMYPLAFALATADMEATYFLESSE